MSLQPATPIRPGEGASEFMTKTDILSMEKRTANIKLKQTPVHEPSPASTYGETHVGDSVPATPLDPTAVLLQSLRAVQIDDSIERISSSPITGRDSQRYASSADLGGGKILDTYSSPSKSTGIANFNIPSANSSPTAERHKEIMESPSWRRGDSSFVRHVHAQVEDPFVSSGPGQDPGSVGTVFRPREDRAGVPLSGDTAQAFLPPNACVFVANLVSSRTDDQLELAVKNVFQTFGTVYVKIRRDSKGMPFAFCQYAHVSDAQRAITLGRGMLIDGRPCRTEIAKVNRKQGPSCCVEIREGNPPGFSGSLYLSKVTGGPITEGEARQVLSRYGALEKVWYCSQTDKEMFRLPEGIWVMFAFFQDCRDAQVGLRDDPIYRLEQPRMPDDIRYRLGSRSNQSSPMQHSPGQPGSGITSPHAAVRRATDVCSIFVGNLPPSADEEHLRQLFGQLGRINQVEVIRKPSVNANGVNAFAFIEFYTQEEAATVVQAVWHLGAVRLRVERKEWVDPATRRFSPVKAGGSPPDRFYPDPQEAMAVLFQRGVSIGMANAAASQAQASPPPMYAPYAYYQPYNQMMYGSYPQMDAEASTGLQAHGNTYMPITMGQFQYPQASTYAAQYPPVSNRPIYQWPPANSADDATTASTTASATTSATTASTSSANVPTVLNSEGSS